MRISLRILLFLRTRREESCCGILTYNCDYPALYSFISRIKEFKSPSGNSFIFILLLSPLSFYYYTCIYIHLPLHFNVAETVLFVLRMNRIQRASTARCFPSPPTLRVKTFCVLLWSLFKNLAKVIGSMEGSTRSTDRAQCFSNLVSIFGLRFRPGGNNC